MPDMLRIMSFNIRYATAEDGENDWSSRCGLVVQSIRDFAPDLLAMQEALVGQLSCARENPGEYGVVAAGREDGLQRGECTAVFYRLDRFELDHQGHFWLSETPQVPGSISWNASQTRMVTYCHLRLRARPARQLCVFNTHFDHRSARARVESARLLRQRIEEVGSDLPVIVAGDFNATENESVYRIMLHGENSRQTLIDAYRAVHPTPSGEELTRHGFRGDRRGSRIDWILHSPHFHPEQAAIVRDTIDGRFASDHFPVTAVIQWPQS